MQPMDLRGLSPAPVTAFKKDGSLDIEANVRIAKWLASFPDVKSMVILGHAGEGTFLTADERLELIRAYKDAVDVPIIAGITGEGTKVAAEEAKRSMDAGATGALVYPNHGWLRFGFQKGAPQDATRRSMRRAVCRPSSSNIPMPPKLPTIWTPSLRSQPSRDVSLPRTACGT